MRTGSLFATFGLPILLVGVAGCSAALVQRPLVDPTSDSGRGWQAMLDGKPASADFARALAQNHDDPAALFAAANLAYERGTPEAALDHALALLRVASRGQDALAVALAPAVLARMPRLLAEVPNRAPFEEQLIALSPNHLPWPAQYALALNVVSIARRRADADLLNRAQTRAGCVPAIDYVGSAGRRPFLDLQTDTPVAQAREARENQVDRVGRVVQEAPPQPLVASGCQFQLNLADNRAGVRVLRAQVDLGQGRHDIVLDYSGPARLRVDHGPWHEHGGSVDSYGPRWSAQRIDLPAGRHVVEVHIGSYGSSASLGLLAVAAVDADLVSARSPVDTALVDLATALTANLTGDVDALLIHIDRLAARPRFALGLAAAARLTEADPTRPTDILRDRERALWQQALAIDATLPTLARVELDLSGLEMQNERPREAADRAERARQAAPAWWPAHLGAATALRAQGFEKAADDALAKGLAVVAEGQGGCPMLERAFQRAEDREQQPLAGHLIDLLARCDAQGDNPLYWAIKHGDLAKAEVLLRRILPTSAEPLWTRAELADNLLAQGKVEAAQRELESLVKLEPREARVRLRLVDAQLAAGKIDLARATLSEALGMFPAREDIRQAARLLGVPRPLDDYRLDGAQVFRDFLASGRTYEAPAVVVLDRAVERVFPDGTRLILTHSITQVLSKDAIENVGEVQVPNGAEILALRTRKADGTLREAEEIAGKSSVSVPDLAVGDFVEAETLEAKDPREAFAPGFLGERFYFQTPEAPLDRSEYILVAPASLTLEVNRRAGAPAPVESAGPDHTRVLRFAVHHATQLFPERSAVPAGEWVPSVRVSSGITLEAWSRFLADRLALVSRASPEVREVAATIAKQARGQRGQLPEAIVTWVREHIEPEADFWQPATATLSRSRGNRAGLILALARTLGVPADLVMARSLLFAEANAPISTQELDDFHDLLVRFPSPSGDRFIDPRLRRAPFAYLLPGSDGAPAVVVGSQTVVKLTSSVRDSRSVTLRANLESDGAAKVAVTEQLSGWPALEWTELLDRTGKDRLKLRQEFEQRWLGQHFPGAQLGDLSVDAGEGNGGTRVSYTFTSARMAARQGSVLRLRPLFFQSQPGRRFGTEPSRKTALMLGFDVPLDLDAEIALPPGARVLDLGQDGDISARGARFSEERKVSGNGGAPLSITLRRQSRVPIMRVLPDDYQSFAAKLRSVDPLEQGEIRIAVPGK